jgi:Flp pilus assembly protein TadG
MMVELAVCIPVILAVVAVMLNIMGYLNVCARFDRVAAEAVRIEATSASYDAYGSKIRAQRVQNLIQEAYEQEPNSFVIEAKVSVGSNSGAGQNRQPSSQDLSFSMLSRVETFNCSVTYHPWPFDHFAGLNFIKLTHQRHYSVDPYRPGVLL